MARRLARNLVRSAELCHSHSRTETYVKTPSFSISVTLLASVLLVAPAIAQGPQLTGDTGGGARRDSLALVALNAGYVNAFIRSDAAWYDAHLAPDYRCLAGDGSIVSRSDFIDAAKRPMTYRSFSLDSVQVKLVGDVALISAITPYVRADGTRGASRYVDTWVRRDGVWKTLQAHITPIVGR